MTTTYTDLRAYYRTHREALCRFEGVRVAVEVLDLREAWGRLDALVTPLNGKGQQWVDASRLTPLPEPTGRQALTDGALRRE